MISYITPALAGVFILGLPGAGFLRKKRHRQLVCFNDRKRCSPSEKDNRSVQPAEPVKSRILR